MLSMGFQNLEYTHEQILYQGSTMHGFVINSAHVTSEIFGEEAVVVNFVTGKYFAMSGSGPAIWKLFESPISADEVIDEFRKLDGMTATELDQVRDFINALQREKLIVETDDSSSQYASAGNITVAAGGFQTPVLEIHDDLQELIVLDPIHDADPERGWPVTRRE